MPQDEALQTVENETPATANVGKQIDRHEKALLQGDLSDLSNQERKSFYAEVCNSLGLNPMTQPLEYIWLSGDLTLYANKTAANQLRDLHGVSITDLDIQQENGLHTVYAYAEDKTGRTDVDAGIVDVGNARGEALANAKMKAITKAKRRVTLSICGLGFLDETEVEDIPDGATKAANVDHETGEMKPRKPDSWYEDAIKWLIQLVIDHDNSPSKIIAGFPDIPDDHPVEEWPDEWSEKAENSVRRAGNADIDSTQKPTIESGKEAGEASVPKSKNQKSQSGETRSRQNGGVEKDTGTDGGSDRKFGGPEDAVATLCPNALEQGEGEPVAEKYRITIEKDDPKESSQLDRLWTIADVNGWKESWVDRLVKDELGYESMTHIPWGDPYDEICDALEDQELKFWMSRDPDTKEMEFPDEESPDDLDPMNSPLPEDFPAYAKLKQGGLETPNDVLDYKEQSDLKNIDGVGPATEEQIEEALFQIEDDSFAPNEELPF